MVPYALVLFDYDGCTAIVDTKKLVLEGGNLVNGQQCRMRLHGENLAVEILQLSGSVTVIFPKLKTRKVII